jgi:hypothetical protein
MKHQERNTCCQGEGEEVLDGWMEERRGTEAVPSVDRALSRGAVNGRDELRHFARYQGPCGRVVGHPRVRRGGRSRGVY